MNNLNIALKYEKRGYCVIPIKKDKRPFISWAEYQERKVNPSEIREWFTKWPSANIGIVTGQISGIVVIDIDEPQGFEEIEKYLPDSITIPTSKTPKGGQHLYFRAPEKPIHNNSRLIPGCDFRGDGGYIIAPPSTNGKGQAYEWLDGLSLDETEPPPLPADAITLFSSYSTSVLKGKLDKKLDKKENPLKFQLGTRDEDLFHVANCLVNVQGSPEMSRQVVRILAANCDPPFDPKEADNKVKSALERAARAKRNLSGEIREFVLSSPGLILSRNVQQSLGMSRPEDRKITHYALNQMVREGLLERVPEVHGGYRVIDKECEDLDFANADIDSVDLKLPFEIEKKIEIMPGNILTVAGEMNSGKTGFLLNVVKLNMESMNVHFFSSEMGGSELKKRLMLFKSPPNIYNWKFNAYERSSNFADVIVSGRGNLNCIDYLELHDEFYKIGQHLADIHRKLNGAVAFVAIQKNPGKLVGRGGYIGLEKPRLYLTMGRDENGENELKILKAKNWATEQNPNGLKIGFKLVNGCEFIKKGDWE